MSEKFKLDWLVEACTPKVKKLVEKIIEEKKYDLLGVLTQLEILFPKLENDLTLRANLRKITQLPQNPDPSAVATIFLEIEEIFVRLTPGAMSDQEKFLILMEKVHPKTFSDLRQDRYYKHRTQDYASLKLALIEKANEDWLERHLLQQKKQSLQPLTETEPASVNASAPKNNTSVQTGQNGPPSKRIKGGGGKGYTPSPAAQRDDEGRGRGKGKGKGQGKGKGKGSSASRPTRNFPPEVQEAPKFSATIFCKWCKKKGHYEDFCWAKEKWQKNEKSKGTPPRTGETPESFIS